MRCEEREGEGRRDRRREKGKEQRERRGDDSRQEKREKTDEEAGEEETEVPTDYCISPNCESLGLFLCTTLNNK